MHGVDWETYQSMREVLGERPVRITYDRGALELMSPSDVHERLKKLVDRLLVVLSEELDVPIRSQGSMTFNRQDLDRGLEPDECYYIHNEAALRGRDEIDLSVDPPPDLAIEIDVTSSSLNRLAIYAALGVPEIWRFDGTSLHVYLLQSGGLYGEATASRAFPQVPVSELAAHLARRNDMDEVSWVREFRAQVREVMRKKPSRG